jgi:hypothetical protein
MRKRSKGSVISLTPFVSSRVPQHTVPMHEKLPTHKLVRSFAAHRLHWWVAIEKSSDLRSEITLLQYGIADESIAGVYHASQPAFAKECLGRESWLWTS